MRIFLGLMLMLGAASLFTYEHFNLRYWRTPPEVRADIKWAQEVEKFENKSKRLKTALLLLKEWQMTTTDQQFKDLIDKSHPPFQKSQKGKYTLHIRFMPWIEDMKYGYIIEHQVFDSNNNLVEEFSVNFDIGKLW